MGTNFYVETPPCEHCHREYKPLHIGKLSYKGVFSLHIYPDKGINTLQDLIYYAEFNIIRDEYGQTILLDDLIERITKPIV